MKASKKILIIEDCKTTNNLVKNILEQAQYEVVQTYSGTEGLNALSEGGIDLVITDLVMPGLFGTEAIQMMRSQNVNLGIIAISGMVVHLKKAKELGADCILEKPFNAKNLIGTIEKVLEEKKAS